MPVRTSARGVMRAPVMICMLFALGCASTGSSEAKSELSRRAQSGDTDAQYQLGLAFADSILPERAEAIYWLCRASKGGHVPAQLALARLYEKSGQQGGGSAQGHLSNKGSAYFWYTAAASQGSDEALAARGSLAATMDAAEVLEVKRRATRWQQAVCVQP